MKELLNQLLATEDKKKPYTDEQLAQLLGMKREQVTGLRRQYGIADSRTRRKPVLMAALKDILQKSPHVSERDLTQHLRSKGFDISRFAIREYRRECETVPPKKTQPVQLVREGAMLAGTQQPEETNTTNDVFAHFIGCQGSLKTIIEQAKAAVFYPPKGLHTLILGEPGVGKSDLAEAMYQYAKSVQRISRQAPFVFFNCADYVNNPQLLMAQLFGYIRGAFTGAAADKEGLVEKANGGILFLDEVHRLPPEGQELLFYLMDKNCFRRLGETELVRHASVMIIAATTENPDSSLLITFRRRIPMLIEIPSLAARPFNERFELMSAFFAQEAMRTKNSIEIDAETLRALLLFECLGNIGQLLSVIQVSCARAFLNHVINQGNIIRITVEDLPAYARKGLLKIQNRQDIEQLIKGKLIVHPDHTVQEAKETENIYSLSSSIYQYIEERYQDLQNKNMSDETINCIIGDELEVRFKTIIKHIETNVRPVLKTDLVKIVGPQVFDVCEKVQKLLSHELQLAEDKLFYCLAIHLKTTLDRLEEGRMVVNPHLQTIKKEHRHEYEAAKKMVSIMENELQLQFPEDEIGFVAMYLVTFANQTERLEEGRVGIVIISHGHVAEGMADVANRLLGVMHAKSVEMSLDESPENALERVLDTAKSADEGKGVLLLVDMGSLVTFGELVTQKTGIKTRVISRVDTVLAIEAVRKAALQQMTLDELAGSLEENPRYVSRLGLKKEKSQTKPKVLITVCITGEGAALKVKELIESLLPELPEQIEIMSFGAIQGNLHQVIQDVQRTKTVLAVIGTVDPALPQVAFISIEELVKGDGIQRIRALLEGERFIAANSGAVHDYTLQELLAPELIVVDPAVQEKEAVLQSLSDLLIRQQYVHENFLEGIYQREVLRPTYMGNGAAMPHTDPSFVKKPGIAIAKLANPIEWNGNPVQLVYMLALTEECQTMIKQLYSLICSQEFLSAVQQVKTPEQFMAAMHNYGEKG